MPQKVAITLKDLVGMQPLTGSETTSAEAQEAFAKSLRGEGWVQLDYTKCRPMQLYAMGGT